MNRSAMAGSLVDDFPISPRLRNEGDTSVLSRQGPPAGNTSYLNMTADAGRRLGAGTSELWKAGGVRGLDSSVLSTRSGRSGASEAAMRVVNASQMDHVLWLKSALSEKDLEMAELRQQHQKLVERSAEARENWEEALRAKDRAIAQMEEALLSMQSAHEQRQSAAAALDLEQTEAFKAAVGKALVAQRDAIVAERREAEAAAEQVALRLAETQQLLAEERSNGERVARQLADERAAREETRAQLQAEKVERSRVDGLLRDMRGELQLLQQQWGKERSDRDASIRLEKAEVAHLQKLLADERAANSSLETLLAQERDASRADQGIERETREALYTQLGAERQEKGELRATNASMGAEMERLQGVLRAERQEKEELRRAALGERAAAERMQARLAQAVADLEEARQAVAEERLDKEHALQLAAEVRGEAEAYRRQAEEEKAARGDMDRAHGTRILEMEDRLAAAERRERDMRQALEAELAELRVEHEAAAARAVAGNGAAEECNGQLAQAREEVRGLKRKLAAESTRLAAFESAHRAKVSEMQGEIARVQASERDARQKLQQQMAALAKDKEAAQRAVDESRAERRGADGQLRSLQQQLTETQRRLAEELAHHQSMGQVFAEKELALQQSLDEEAQAREVAERRARELQGERDVARQSAEDAQRQLETLQNQRWEAQQAAADAQRQLAAERERLATSSAAHGEQVRLLETRWKEREAAALAAAEELQAKLAELRKENVGLKEDVRRANASIADLSAQVEQLHARLQESAEEQATRVQLLETRLKERDAAATVAAGELQAKVVELRKENLGLKEEAWRNSSNTADLSAQVEQLQTRLWGNAEEQAARVRLFEARLKERDAAAVAAAEEFQAKLSELRKENLGLKEDVWRGNARSTDLTAQVEELHTRLRESAEEQAARVAEVEDQMNQLQAAEKALRASLQARLDEERTQKEARVAAHARELKAWADKYSLLADKCKSQQQLLAEARAECNELTRAVAERARERSDLQQQLAAATEEHQGHLRECADERRETQRMHAEAMQSLQAVLREKAQAMEALQASAAERAEELQARIHGLQKTVATKEDALASARVRCDELEHAATREGDVTRDLRARARSLEEEMQGLREQLVQRIKDKDAAVAQYKEGEMRAAELTRKLETLQGRLQEQSSSVDRYLEDQARERQDHMEEIAVLRQRLADAGATCEQLQQNQRALEEKVSQLTYALSHEQQLYRRLEDEMERALRSSDREIAKLEGSLQAIKGEGGCKSRRLRC
eukprot:jgi/Mesvir1/19059/Mv12819-RA.3